MSWSDDRLDDLNGKVDETSRQAEEMRGEMRTELKAVRGEMHAELSAVRGEMKEGAASLRSEIQAMRSDMDRRLDGLQSAMTSLTVTIFATTTSGFIALLAALIITQL